MLKIVFFGTSAFAGNILKHLLSDQIVEVVAVVTRPDRPRGRSLSLSYPPVKEVYTELGLTIPLHQPEKASTEEFASLLKSYQADLFVVVAYGEIIKLNILQIPKKSCINIHASLLPKYRGAAPIHRCLMDGEKETGITIIEMTPAMDAGDMLEICKMPIPEEMTFEELNNKLCALACIAISKTLCAFDQNKVLKTPQDTTQVTFAPKLLPEEEEISWNKPAVSIHNLIRALSPKPGAWCKIKINGEEKRLKIKRSQVIQEKSGIPGAFIEYNKNTWIVACQKGALKILEVQLEGKKTLSAEDFIKGAPQNISFL